MTEASGPEPLVETCSASEMRTLMASFPSGVVIVMAVDPGGSPRGMTCSLCSVAVAPPTLLVCLRRASPTLWALRQSGAFAVNFIHAAASDTAEPFASGTPDRFDRVRWQLNPGGAGPHPLDASHAVADCRVCGVAESGSTHTQRA